MPESDASAREANSQLQGKIQRSSATFSQSRPAIYQTSYYESIPIIMNALANSMQKIALQTGRRFVSSASHAPKAPFVPVRSAAPAKRSIFVRYFRRAVVDHPPIANSLNLR
jgi:hypothetical protein